MMKKLLLLLLIAPMIGNSQTLDLPISAVGYINAGEIFSPKYIPSGKIWQINDMSDNWYFSVYLPNQSNKTNFNVGTGHNNYKNLLVMGGYTIQSPYDGRDQYFSYIEYDTYPTANSSVNLEETTISLNIPVSDVINVVGGDFFYNQTNGISVPEGKALQLVGISSPLGDNSSSQDWANFGVLNNNLSQVINFKCDVGFVFSSGSNLFLTDDTWYNSLFSFVMYDLDSQNLAFNAPNQTPPTLYPNPTSSLLALNSNKEYDIEVFDMAGNKVMALTGNTIDMSHLSSATYIVKALDKVENEEVSYKVVKN